MENEPTYTQQTIFGNLGYMDMIHKVEFNIPNLAAAGGIVLGLVLVGYTVTTLIKQKTA